MNPSVAEVRAKIKKARRNIETLEQEKLFEPSLLESMIQGYHKMIARGQQYIKEKQAKCQHNPLDRDVNDNEEQYCTICEKVTKTAEELYPNH